MKKIYCKPQISFEDFELCANIAVGCEHKTNHTIDQCAYDLGLGPGFILFLDNVKACTFKVGEGYNKICYHNFYEDSNVFTS